MGVAGSYKISQDERKLTFRQGISPIIQENDGIEELFTWIARTVSNNRPNEYYDFEKESNRIKLRLVSLIFIIQNYLKSDNSLVTFWFNNEDTVINSFDALLFPTFSILFPAMKCQKL